MREQVARALNSKGYTLGQQLSNRPDEEIGAYDEVVSRYAEDPSPAVREQVAKALIGKRVQFKELTRLRKRWRSMTRQPPDSHMTHCSRRSGF